MQDLKRTRDNMFCESAKGSVRPYVKQRCAMVLTYSTMLSLGTKAPEFSLKDVSDRQRSLRSDVRR